MRRVIIRNDSGTYSNGASQLATLKGIDQRRLEVNATRTVGLIKHHLVLPDGRCSQSAARMIRSLGGLIENIPI